MVSRRDLGRQVAEAKRRRRALLAKAEPLSAAGWYVQGSELLGAALPLYDRAHDAIEDVFVSIDDPAASDAEIIAEHGPGEISTFEGERSWLPQPIVEVRDRLLRLQSEQARGRVLIVADGAGGYGFTSLDLDA